MPARFLLIGAFSGLKKSPLAARGKSHAGAKNGDCYQFASRHDPRNKALSLKRIGWLYPIFRDLHFLPGAAKHTNLAVVGAFVIAI